MTTTQAADEAAIIALTIDYCWALDHKRFADFSQVFAEDVIADYGVIVEGCDNLIAQLSAAGGGIDLSQHVVTNHQVHVHGDVATGRCQYQSHYVNGNDLMDVGGCYFDTFVRTDAGWRISKRVTRVTWRTTTHTDSTAIKPQGKFDRAKGFAVAGSFEVQPGDLDRVLAAAAALTKSAESAPGYLDCSYSVDASNPNRVRVFEQWASEGEYRGHADTPAVAGLRDLLADAQVRDDVRRFEIHASGPFLEYFLHPFV